MNVIVITIKVAAIKMTKNFSRLLWPFMVPMSLVACGSQPAQVTYSVPVSFQSQHCAVSQTEAYIWLEQENEWLNLPQQTRQQLKYAQINWLESNVLIVSQGTKPSAGYGIDLSNWLLEQNYWQARRVIYQPEVGRLQAQMITSPCTLVKIPKTIKSFTLNNEQGKVLGRWPY
jgi:hypothetical protein